MKYTRGPVSTERPWAKPTKETIRAWIKDMEYTIEHSGYTASLVGRSLTNIEATHDVDVVYTGKFDATKMEYLLINSVITGFRHNLLIDARWQANIETATCVDGVITILPTEFVFLNYFEHDYGNGRRVINDYRLNPLFAPANDNLSGSRFDLVHKQLKPYQYQLLVQHGSFPHMLLADYMKE
tara:strand:+ start:652 stop:1200 length:549 start_codon:yes stop_codon:yes gene_type:complete